MKNIIFLFLIILFAALTWVQALPDPSPYWGREGGGWGGYRGGFGGYGGYGGFGGGWGREGGWGR